MASSYHITVDHSPDGEFCRIRSTDADGNEGVIIVEANDLVSLIATLAQLATNIQNEKGSQNIPYFPTHSFEVRQEPGDDHVLVTFRVDPELAMTFGLDKDSLRGVLSEISQFLEDGSGGTKSYQTH